MDDRVTQDFLESLEGEASSFALPFSRYEQLAWMRRFRKRVTDEIRAQALASFLPTFELRYAQRLKTRMGDPSASIGHGAQMLSGLQRDGHALGRLEDEDRRRIRSLTLAMADELEQALDQVDQPKFADGQRRIAPETHAPVYEAVIAGLERAGVFAALNAYAGKPVALKNLAIQVNTAKETLAKYGELDGAGLPERPTSYMHVDSTDWPPVKVLIYLNEVGPDQGPFRYVVGSQRLMAPFEAAVRKTNDKLRHSATVLCALPAHLGQNANFGDYIDPGAPDVVRLLEKEVAVCDGQSDLVLFDNDGVHRGGMVREGRRCILQATFIGASKLPGGRLEGLARP